MKQSRMTNDRDIRSAMKDLIETFCIINANNNIVSISDKKTAKVISNIGKLKSNLEAILKLQGFSTLEDFMGHDNFKNN